MDLERELCRLVKLTDLSVTDDQIKKHVEYVEILHKWNKTYNLSAVRDPKDMLVKHILDSIVVVPSLVTEAEVLDIGTGPGLPGIPLAVMFPNIKFTLIDALGKRIRFVKQAIHQLNIHNVTAIQSRVEDFRSSIGYDAIISRAFASIKDMIVVSEHLLAKNGKFLALKGQINQSELSEMPSGFFVEDIKRLLIPSLNSERHLIKIARQ